VKARQKHHIIFIKKTATKKKLQNKNDKSPMRKGKRSGSFACEIRHYAKRKNLV